MPQDHNAPGQEPEEQQNQPAGTEGAPEGAPGGAQAPASGEGEQSPTEGEPTSPEGAQPPADDSGLWEGVDESHPLRKTVADLRSESAARRTENRRLQEANDELKQQLDSATSNEDYQAAIAEYDDKIKAANLEAARERTGRKFGLPDALVSRLAGDTEEALEADARELQALVAPQGAPAPVPAPQDPPRGGLKPNEERMDPAATAAAIRKRNASGVQSM